VRERSGEETGDLLRGTSNASSFVRACGTGKGLEADGLPAPHNTRTAWCCRPGTSPPCYNLQVLDTVRSRLLKERFFDGQLPYQTPHRR